METPKLQWSGIDQMTLGIGAHMPEETHKPLLEQLTTAKALAATDQPQKWSLMAGLFIPLHYGNKRYPLALADQDTAFFFNRQHAPIRATPNIMVELSPRFTTRRDIDQTAAHVHALLEELGFTIDWIKPSRVDLACDISCGRDQCYQDYFDHMHQRKYTTAARTQQQIEREDDKVTNDLINKGNRLEYFRIGAGALILRIYNKTQELKVHSEKLWETLLWENPSVGNVTRVEFQLRRDQLNIMPLNTLESLKDLGPAWAWLTSEWFKLHTRSENGDHRVRPITEFWKTVQSAQPAAVARTPVKHTTPNALERINQGMGNITSALAQLYPETPDISEARIMTNIVKLWKETSKTAEPKLWDTVATRREKIRLQQRDHLIADQPPSKETCPSDGRPEKR